MHGTGIVSPMEGRHSHNALELAVIAGNTGKTNFQGNIQDGFFRIMKQDTGAVDTDTVQVFQWAGMHGSLEQPSEMGKAYFA